MSDYVAGSCNIGSTEIHRRYQVAIIGSIAYLAMAFYVALTGASTLLTLATFAPALLASVGFNQARRKFCFAYGLMGVFNFNSGNAVSKVKDPVALAADRAYAIKILLISFPPALIASGILFAF